MNKKKYYILLWIAALTSLTTTSCSGWFDVIPRSSVYEEDLYKNEIGFQQVLTGLYQKMGGSSLYGRETTFGLVDVVSGMYYIPQTQDKAYLYATQYNYEYADTKSAITGIWNDAYNAIANANELLRNAGIKQDVAQDETQNYTVSNAFNSKQTRDIIVGEALAVRALLHFDLVRMFGMAPAVNGNKPAIPYVTTLKKEITPQSTVNEALKKVITDLLQSATLLEKTDPVVKNNPTPDDSYFAKVNRPTHLNYYAVCALLARVYLYAGNPEEAGTWAKKVIDANAFKWSSVTALNQKDYVGTSELIFNLFIRDMETSITPYFRYGTDNSAYLLPIGEQRYKDLYTTGDRRAKAFQLYQGSYLNQKYVISSGTTVADTATVQNRMPMIRLSEVYYIAAESDLDGGDIKSAAKELNIVRKNRGLSNKSMNTAAEIRQELNNEYQREFASEGQLFYYIKRINQPDLIDTQFVVDFVFPIPDNEYTYGNRQKNK